MKINKRLALIMVTTYFGVALTAAVITVLLTYKDRIWSLWEIGFLFVISLAVIPALIIWAFSFWQKVIGKGFSNFASGLFFVGMAIGTVVIVVKAIRDVNILPLVGFTVSILLSCLYFRLELMIQDNTKKEKTNRPGDIGHHEQRNRKRLRA